MTQPPRPSPTGVEEARASRDEGERRDEATAPSHDAELRDMFGESGGMAGEGGDDAEMQRALLAARLFGGPPVSIGRFLVEHVLGVGASAVVYATRDPLLDRRVALKVLSRPPPDRREVVLSRVIREARAAAQLSHGNLVSIYEVGEWDGRPFIAMELIEGATLAQWLVDEPRPLAEICEVFLQAGRGLAAAHAQGRVHRDFKPANVLVSHHGRVVVSDFGLAGDISAVRPQLATGTGEMAQVSALPEEDSSLFGPVLGTPAYAAPEQRAGVPAHPSADVYSFAISLIEALLGYHPGAAGGEGHGEGVSARSSPSSPSSRSPRSSRSFPGPRQRRGAAPGPAASPSRLASPGRPPWQLALRPRVPRPLFAALCAAAEPELWRREQSLGPLLEALRACAPARKRQRRGVYLVGASALVLGVALAAAIALGLSRWGWRESPFAVGATLSASPRELSHEVQALLQTPALQRDDEWRRRARELLMAPIATEIECRWQHRPRDLAIAGEHVMASDEDGAVHVCDLRDGSVAAAPLAHGVGCMRSDERGTLELGFEHGHSERYVEIEGRWQRREERAGDELRSGLVRGTDGLCFSYQASASDGRRKLFLVRHQGAPDDLHYQPDPAAPPRLLAERVLQFRADQRLRFAVIISSSVLVYDFECDRLITSAIAAAGNRGIRVISLAGDYAIVNGFEGPLYWWRLGDEQWHDFPISQTGIKALTMSPAGGRVAVISEAGHLQVVELESGWRYPLADGQMRQVRFLDADRVVAIDVSGRIWRWSLSALRSRILAEHVGEGAMWGLALSPGAEAVASSSGGTGRSEVRLTSLLSEAERSPQRTWPMPAGVGVHALTFDGETLFAGSSDSLLHRWRWRTGEALGALPLPRARWIWTAVVAPRPDGKSSLLIGTGRLLAERVPGDTRSDRDLMLGSRVLSLQGDRLEARYEAPRNGNTGITSLDVSPDGRLAVAATSALELALIELQSGRVTTQRVTTSGEVRSAQFFDEGRDEREEREGREEGGNDRRQLVAIGDDGYLSTWAVAAAGPSGAPTLARTASVFVGHGQLFKLAVGRGEAVIGADDGYVGRRELPSGRELLGYTGHTISVTALGLDAAGRWLVSGDKRGRLCLRPLDRRECFTTLFGHKADFAITNARFLPDGRLVTSSNDRTVRLWSPLYDLTDEALARELARFQFRGAR